MKCKTCKSDRVASISAKCSDMFDLNFKGLAYEGYVPLDMGIDHGNEDYVEFEYCLQCGQIQAQFPVQDPLDC